MLCSQCTHNKGLHSWKAGNPALFFPDSWEHCVFSGAFGFPGRQLTEEPWSLPNSLALKKSLTDAMQQVVDAVGGSSLHEISHSG